jgi:hypothetical protein
LNASVLDIDMLSYSIDVGCRDRIAFVFESPVPRCDDPARLRKEFQYQVAIHQRQKPDKLVLVCAHADAQPHIVKIAEADAKWPCDGMIIHHWQSVATQYLCNAAADKLVTNERKADDARKRIAESLSKLRPHVSLPAHCVITSMIVP